MRRCRCTRRQKLTEAFDGNLNGRNVLVLGVSYRQDVGDTRYSPTELLVRGAEGRGAKVTLHDPLLDYWQELARKVEQQDIPAARGFDAVVFAVSHREYAQLDLKRWLDGASRPVVLDANHVLSSAQLADARSAGCTTLVAGSGE